MIDDLKPYPEYKKADLPWLSKIPVHWRVVRNGSLFAQRNQTGFAHLPILEVSLKTGIRVRDFENSLRKQVMSDLGKYKRAAKGDLAYNMMRMWQGAVGVASVDDLVSPAYIVARPFSEVLARYYSYLFRTDVYMFEVDAYSRGIVKDRNRLYWDQFKQMVSLAPRPDEQIAIVRFLDLADRRIRRYIRAKTKLIALLNEQKQAIIQRAVTRGLDPNVRLKASGVEGLGTVPEHWEVRRLKSICKLQRGYDLPNDKFIAGDYPVYGSNGIIGYHNSFSTRGPCVTVGRSGSVGAVNYVESDFWAHNTTLFVLDNFGNHWGYIYFLLKSIALKTVSAGSAVPTLNRNYIHRLYVAVPSLNEQEEVVLFIRNNTLELDAAFTHAEREIALIREYRTRLVADVVTGQLDVRAAAAKLPDEAAELEPLDDLETLSEEQETGHKAGVDVESAETEA